MMYAWPFLVLFLFIGSDAGTIKNPPGQFSFASYYGSYMVLQRGLRNTIWGYHSTAGASVSLQIGSDNYQTQTVTNPGGVVIWEILIDDRPDEGPYTITASTAGSADITLNDVLFGDVYLCSGQSNMVHRLDRLDNPQPDIDDVVNYAKVRRMQVARRYSFVPLDDVESIALPWAIPTPGNMVSFSAICWLFGRDMNAELDRPIGLIQSDWGGTRIETWMSPEALFSCYGDAGPPAGGNQNTASALYNGMIHPFFKLPIYGALWYQGEANQNNAAMYGCTQPSMINNWRQKWQDGTGETDINFPFGFVQLAPNRNNDNAVGFPDVRWHQTVGYGYAPNDRLERVFMAVALDLPDFNSPHGSIHPRYKRQIATRLALGAYNVAYGMTSKGRFQGPFPTNILTVGNSISVQYDNNTADLTFRGTVGFEVCCSVDINTFCPDANANWVLSDMTDQDTSSILIGDPCEEGQFRTGLRYLWRESPCALEQCPIYSRDNDLPAPPFTHQGSF